MQELPTHGGSLRVFAQRTDTGLQVINDQVRLLLQKEESAGMRTAEYYTGFQGKSEKVKDDFVAFLIEAKRKGKSVAAYGAAAKGNTLMNFAGIRSDLIQFAVDKNPAKQGKYMPGSRIPIVSEDRLIEERPDYVVILPWNLREEVMQQLAYVQEWGGKFVTAVPDLKLA